ncbi:hypothetical protein CLV47_108165 [Antricoccus suffuscus]|uniref:Enoyl reductase (ER) domain-containing protein n=1 Tax=Antricoccus suffuscus TaxID=1629062 RepID=A0A2T0ZZM2_9ACTN|nr:NADP-dependent oxidoreductase [Antricoccus suffuscus]PRZ41806.1 hypothetical protein CLV47_108165 [Antricoccus suffuscus]
MTAASTPTTNRQILLSQMPTGTLTEDCFSQATVDVVAPGPGEVLCRTIYLSIDPAARAWMQAATYRSQLDAGQVMSGFTVAEVVAGDLPTGTIVGGDGGWQQYFTRATSEVQVLDIRAALSHYAGPLGINGLTAYFGLLDIGKPVAGETVVVSAAAGATGNIVGQIAKHVGARVIGITGSDDKNDLLRERLGFDATVNHRSETFRADLKAACPDGIDVYFDNVGGPVLEAVLSRANLHARIACCGVVSQYDTTSPAGGPRGVPGHLVTKRIRMEGFLVHDYEDQKADALDKLHEWVTSGELVVLEEIIDGLDSAPAALIGQLAGSNVGKLMVRVGADPA